MGFQIHDKKEEILYQHSFFFIIYCIPVWQFSSILWIDAVTLSF